MPNLRPELCLIALLGMPSLAAQGRTQKPTKKSPPPVAQTAKKVEPPPRLKRFHRDLGRNLIGLFSRDNLIPLIVGSAASGISAGFDDDVGQYFGRKSRFGAGEDVGNILGKSWVLGAAAGTLMLVGEGRDSNSLRKLSYSLGQGLALNGALTLGLKVAVRRNRPNGDNRRSFPSGHASQAFVFATILSHHYKKATIPAYLTASLIAASRLDRDAHHLSDVVTGAALGYIVGRTVVRESQKEARLIAVPFVSPSNGQIGVTVMIDLP